MTERGYSLGIFFRSAQSVPLGAMRRSQFDIKIGSNFGLEVIRYHLSLNEGIQPNSAHSGS